MGYSTMYTLDCSLKCSYNTHTHLADEHFECRVLVDRVPLEMVHLLTAGRTVHSLDVRAS